MEGDKSENAQRGIKTSGTFPRYLLFRFFAATSFFVPSHSLMTNCPHFWKTSEETRCVRFRDFKEILQFLCLAPQKTIYYFLTNDRGSLAGNFIGHKFQRASQVLNRLIKLVTASNSKSAPSPSLFLFIVDRLERQPELMVGLPIFIILLSIQ